MRHVDDGTIHAWLDGAITDPAESAWIEEHLRWCAACGARVADERSTFEQAHALLAVAVPAIEPPPFDEVVAKAAGREESQTVPATAAHFGRERRLLHLGWAASLVLAAGIGWMARQMTVEQSGRSLESTVVAEAPGIGPRTTADPIEPRRPGQLGSESARVAPQLPDEPIQQSASARQREEQPAAAPPRAKPQEVEEQLAAAAAASVESLQQRRDDALAGAAIGAAAGATAQAFVAPPTVTSARGSPAGLTETVTVTSAPPAAAPAQGDTTAWRALPRTEAAARSGMALYGLDGLDPVLTSISADNRIVRTVYRLGSGATVELDQERTLPPVAANSLQAAARAPVPRGRAANIAADVAASPGVWSEIRGDVRLSLRTGSISEDANSLAMRLRVE